MIIIQNLAINILNSQYKFIVTFLLLIGINFLFNIDILTYCSLEQKDEYIRFLKDQSWELDKQIEALTNEMTQQEIQITALETQVTELKATLTSSEAEIQRLQSENTRLHNLLSESKKYYEK